MNKHQEILRLFNLYLGDKCSDEQVRLLFQYISSDENKDFIESLIKDLIQTSDDTETGPDQLKQVNLDDVYDLIRRRIEAARKKS